MSEFDLNDEPEGILYELTRELAAVRRQRDALRGRLTRIQEACIRYEGRWRTLLNLYESEDWRALCGECQEPDCDGCASSPDPPDPPDREVWEDR